MAFVFIAINKKKKKEEKLETEYERNLHSNISANISHHSLSLLSICVRIDYGNKCDGT
jgi:hypothetical protein